MVKGRKSRIVTKSHTKFPFFPLFVFLVCAGLLYAFMQNGKSAASEELSDSIAIVDTIYKRAESLDGPNTLIDKNPESNLWWISDDNFSILTPASSVAYSVKFDVNDVPLGNTIEHILTRPGMRAFYDLSTRVLKDSGFKKNQLNSSTSLSDTKYYDYVEAYENGDTKCAIIINPDPANTGTDSNTQYYTTTTSCTDTFAVAYADQSPILRDLNIQDAVISRKTEPVKDYFVLNINFRRTGHYTVAKKEKDKYIELYSGQDNPPCSLVDLKKVPKEVYGKCYEMTPRLRD